MALKNILIALVVSFLLKSSVHAESNLLTTGRFDTVQSFEDASVQLATKAKNHLQILSYLIKFFKNTEKKFIRVIPERGASFLQIAGVENYKCNTGSDDAVCISKYQISILTEKISEMTK